ncbi:MAG: NUDIX hydrolase [Dorea sp.]
MSEEVKRVRRELAYEGTILHVYKDYMEFESGNSAQWDFIHHDGAAAVVPVMDDGRILMVKQYRNALERDTLEIPAGKLDDPKEEGIVCASRELEEETGYRSENLEWLITLRTTVAFCDEKIEIFVARDLIPSRQHLDEDEYVDVKAYTLDELKEMIFSGKIEDSKTMAAILAYESKYLK